MNKHSEQWRVDSNTKRGRIGMDIKMKRQNYEALQKARADLVESAVEEIVESLEGLDPDVCEEILAKLTQRLTGRVTPKAPKAPSGLSAAVAQQEAETRETLARWGEQIKEQAAKESAKRAEEAAERARQAQVQAEANKLPTEARMIALYKGLFS
jgi:leucyl-tRNA synthetase